MHPRTAEILACLDRELTTLRAAVDAVPRERRDARPAPDRWSVAEVIEHLARTEAAVLKACTRELATAREAGLPAETDTTSVLALLPVEAVGNRDRRLNAPEPAKPKGLDAATAWAQLEATRARFVEFVTSCDGLALGAVTFAHPAIGPLNLYQWLLFAAGHHRRHAAQIREVGEQLAARADA